MNGLVINRTAGLGLNPIELPRSFELGELYPNPFNNATDFYFQNNQAGQVMDINIQIYTVTGRLVKTINESFYNDGFRVGPISWDGKSSNGENLSAGLYIANLNINLENGKFETKSIRIAITP